MEEKKEMTPSERMNALALRAQAQLLRMSADAFDHIADHGEDEETNWFLVAVNRVMQRIEKRKKSFLPVEKELPEAYRKMENLRGMYLRDWLTEQVERCIQELKEDL